MKARFGRSLTARIYLFSVCCVAVVVLVQIVLSKVVFEPPMRSYFVRIQTALVTAVVSADPEGVRLQEVVETYARQVGDAVAVVDQHGTVLAAAGEPLPTLGRSDWARLRGRQARWVSERVLALPIDGRGRLDGAALVMKVPPRPFGFDTMALILALLLAVLLLASTFFGRGLVLSLRRLSTAAAAFGDGQLTARARLARRDELGEVGRSFDAMADRVTAVLDANRALMGAVSHELRTPMARIRVALDLAAEDATAAQELLGGVGDDLGELEHMVDDILTMTRLDAAAGAPRLRTAPTAPAELGARASARWHERHAGRALELDVRGELPLIDVDPALLRRVVDNLLDNAARHAPATTPVSLRIDRDGDRVRFAIIDRGPGMTADEVRQAFTPFWRSDASRTRDTGGVGLGLALARQVALAHGGDVTLDSAPGRGTTATLSVPVG